MTNNIAPVETTALSQVTSAEIDIQIATARRYARNKAEVIRAAGARVTTSQAVAQSMTYELPRQTADGKPISGKSVRLAEVIAATYGNLRISVRAQEPGPGDRMVAAQAAAMDLETNTVIVIEKHRRITDKKGMRYSDDMVAMTIAAASAIAFREAVFKIVDPEVLSQVYERARAKALGDPTKVAEYTMKALEYFDGKGLMVSDVCALVNRKDPSEFTPEDLRSLNSIKAGIEQGEVELISVLKAARGGPITVDVEATTEEADPLPPSSVEAAENDAPKETRRRGRQTALAGHLPADSPE
jgi:hypothetical protein